MYQLLQESSSFIFQITGGISVYRTQVIDCGKKHMNREKGDGGAFESWPRGGGGGGGET